MAFDILDNNFNVKNPLKMHIFTKQDVLKMSLTLTKVNVVFKLK